MLLSYPQPITLPSALSARSQYPFAAMETTFVAAVQADGNILGWGILNGVNGSTIPPNLNSLSLPVTVRGSVNANVPGTYVLTYIATNGSGAVATTTRTVIIKDTAAPTLTLLGNNSLNIDLGSAFGDPGAKAIDACEGDLSLQIVRSGTVNVNLPGAYTLTYTVTDSSGNSSSTNRTVLVRSPPALLGFNAFLSGTNAVTGSPVVQFVADFNPNGLPTMAYAQFGLRTPYAGRSTSVSVAGGYKPSSFFATLDGLILGATYHFRVVASNSLGIVSGPDRTFTVPLSLLRGISMPMDALTPLNSTMCSPTIGPPAYR